MDVGAFSTLCSCWLSSETVDSYSRFLFLG